MKRYEIIFLEKDTCLVFSISSFSPLKKLDDITEDILNRKIYKCDVYFDFLLSNLNSNERFAKIKYSNGEFVDGTFEYVNFSRNNIIRKKATEFYKSNHKNFDWTLVSSTKKKMIEKGIVI